MKKRILSALLAALMIIGSVGTFAIGTSAAEYTDFTLAVEPTKVDDTTYKVDIMMYNSPMISSMNIAVTFDNSKVKLVDYEGYAPDAKPFPKYAPTSCLPITSNLGSNVDFNECSEVTAVMAIAGIDETVNGKLLGLTFKLEDGVKNANISINVKDPCIQEVQGFPATTFTPNVVSNIVGVLTLDELSLESATYTYDGTAKSLTIKGVDDSMNVSWTNNGKINAGTYNVTAVVSKAGYESKTLTATLTINKAQAKLAGVELWAAKEGTVPEIKSMANAFADVNGKTYPVDYSNAAVVKDGETYKVTGVTVIDTNVELVDTTVVPKFLPAEEIVDTIVGEAEVTAAPVSPLDKTLPDPTTKHPLPYGYSLAIKTTDNLDVIAADGSITAPEDGDATVTVTYDILDENNNPTGETITLTYTIKQKSSDDSVLALLLLYYSQKLEASKTPVEAVKASVASGAVEAGTAVTLSTATAGATIHYTTDGTTATVLSPVYTGPIVVKEGMTINAIAKKTGMITSGQSSFVYTIGEAPATSITLKADAANIKYMEGRGDKFEPEANATRYEVIKALANVFDIKTTNAALELTDVDAEYKELVDLCTAAGIIKGYGDKTFRGNDPITRAEVATIICNIMSLDVEGAKSANFTDVSGWATNYVNACANAGYVQGNGDGTFAPSANITRAQLATIINNITGAEEGTSCSYDDVVEGKWYYGIVCAAAK